jgi:hypothetical protein
MYRDATGADLPKLIVLDLVDDETALELARLFAERTGRTVTVRDGDGRILGTFRGATKN